MYHLELHNAIHVRRSRFLKPSSGDVEIVPMMLESEASSEASSTATAASEQLGEERAPPDIDERESNSSFMWFRINYVLVMSAIMLADGLQGKVSTTVILRFSLSKSIRRVSNASSLSCSSKGHIYMFYMKDTGILSLLSTVSAL